MKITIIFLFLTLQIFAQNLKFIPDSTLRKELKRQGFTTNDSLDIKKTQGRNILELNNLGITNIDGLQYFEQLAELSICDNQISNLTYLPKNINRVNCSRNKIERIDSLPNKITDFFCSNNEISFIGNLPNSLIRFGLSDNKLIKLPILPKDLSYINYLGNPIIKDSLPDSYKQITCDDPFQNCLPYELIDWNILYISTKDTCFEITGAKIILTEECGWGQGTKIEVVEFKRKNNRLIANKIKYTFDYESEIRPRHNEYVILRRSSCLVAELKSTLNDIIINNMRVNVPFRDSIVTIDLTKKKNGINCSMGCHDCSNIHLQYLIYTKSDTIKLQHGFTDMNSFPICDPERNNPENVKDIIDWLYNYRMANLLIPKLKTIKYLYNESLLEKIIRWEKIK